MRKRISSWFRWGKYHKGLFRTTLKLSFQFHHMLTALFAVLDTVRLILTAQAAPLTARTIVSCYSSMLVTLVMSLGAGICLAVMGRRIKLRNAAAAISEGAVS